MPAAVNRQSAESTMLLLAGKNQH